jgi:hypothetical protein
MPVLYEDQALFDQYSVSNHTRRFLWVEDDYITTQDG